MSSGLKLAGTKFFCLSANERSIQLKKVRGYSDPHSEYNLILVWFRELMGQFL